MQSRDGVLYTLERLTMAVKVNAHYEMKLVQIRENPEPTHSLG